MSVLDPAPSRHLRRSHTATCLALALGLSSIATSARAPRLAPTLPTQHRALPSSFDLPQHFSAGLPISWDAFAGSADQGVPIRQVLNCDDSGAGSLRAEVAAATNGGTIDLSQLVCSTITLSSEIVVSQDSLRLLGPGADQLTIDGGSHSRIFNHTGSMLFEVDDLSIEHGYYRSDFRGGGCISTNGTVGLVHSVVSHCVLYGTRGGGIVAANGLSLKWSEISDCHAYSITGQPTGGGAYAAGIFQAKYSTISNNTAYRPPLQFPLSIGGGVFAAGTVDIEYSTISGNRSGSYAGLYIGTGNQPDRITNSTISSNVADSDVGGIFTRTPLVLRNSTVISNTTHESSVGAGVRAENVTLTLYSSIIAGNGGPDGEGDVDGIDPNAAIIGANNLIVSSTLPTPGGTIGDCPRTEPLADNGGPTLTHALKHDSPAIDQGSNPASLVDDQRFAPRAAGLQADIGAVERQPGEADDRLLVDGFDGRCDG